MNPPNINYKAIRQYIQRTGFEGASHNVGKVPSNKVKINGVEKLVPVGDSGVTIGVGFDLGQHNKQDLVNMGFTNRMIEKFSPYLGLKGHAAKTELDKRGGLVLNAHPSNNQDYVEAIEKPIMYYSDRIASNYDKATGVPGDFSRLEGPIKGSILSVFYQMGMGKDPAKVAPKFWKHATSKNCKVY